MVLLAAIATAPVACIAPSPEPAPDAGVLIGLSVHVEGWRTEVRDRDQYEAHVANLETLAAAAEAHDAVLTFELGPTFVEATAAWGGGDLLASFADRGHTIAVHADVGGDPEQFATTDEFTAELVAQRAAVEALVPGIEVTHVTGICSADPWVEAALAAGFETTAGLVEYCAMSLDPADLPEGVTQDCASPVACHGEPPRAYDQTSWVWWADSSAHWLTPADDGLLLVAGGGAGPVCASEAASGVTVGAEGCTGDDEDLALTSDALADGTDDLDADHTSVVWFTWSVGTPVDEEYAEEWFSMVERSTADGSLTWSSPTEVLAAARANG